MHSTCVSTEWEELLETATKALAFPGSFDSV